MSNEETRGGISKERVTTEIAKLTVALEARDAEIATLRANLERPPAAGLGTRRRFSKRHRPPATPRPRPRRRRDILQVRGGGGTRGAAQRGDAAQGREREPGGGAAARARARWRRWRRCRRWNRCTLRRTTPPSPREKPRVVRRPRRADRVDAGNGGGGVLHSRGVPLVNMAALATGTRPSCTTGAIPAASATAGSVSCTSATTDGRAIRGRWACVHCSTTTPRAPSYGSTIRVATGGSPSPSLCTRRRASSRRLLRRRGRLR